MRKKDFGKGPVDIAVYMMATPAEPDIGIEEWTVTSKRLALQIKSYFERGFRELEITSMARRKKTYYNIVPNIQPNNSREDETKPKNFLLFILFLNQVIRMVIAEKPRKQTLDSIIGKWSNLVFKSISSSAIC